MGYDVILAQDGEEVLAYLQQNHSIDAVLLDIIMPRKDGIETLRDIRKFSSSLPVIMVSDASLNDKRRTGYEAWSYGFPFEASSS